MEIEPATWSGRSVFVTGHTGFKGGWLSLWLDRLGAAVSGYALDPPTDPNLFEVARVGERLASDGRGDIRDLEATTRAMAAARPEVVFHLAAQPLVRHSYDHPVDTYAANVMGTAHVLEAARRVDSVRAVVVVTTDKCYEEGGAPSAYREDSRLGGHDPYSASKACAELVCASYRASFFAAGAAGGREVALATARAGNVVGGGDWAVDRLLPDCVRAFSAGEAVRLRYPHAVRPWQHVLDPIAGYLTLAERLIGRQGRTFSEAWNFGPGAADEASVRMVAERAARLLGGTVAAVPDAPDKREAALLKLDTTKARSRLGWVPRWPLERALEETAAWYRAFARQDDMRAFSEAQIAAYAAGEGRAS